MKKIQNYQKKKRKREKQNDYIQRIDNIKQIRYSMNARGITLREYISYKRRKAESTGLIIQSEKLKSKDDRIEIQYSIDAKHYFRFFGFPKFLFLFLSDHLYF